MTRLQSKDIWDLVAVKEMAGTQRHAVQRLYGRHKEDQTMQERDVRRVVVEYLDSLLPVKHCPTCGVDRAMYRYFVYLPEDVALRYKCLACGTECEETMTKVAPKEPESDKSV